MCSINRRPALATASHSPTGFVPVGRAGYESSPRVGSIGTVTCDSNFQTSNFTLRTSTRFLIIPARALPPLGGTRYARSDTPRTPLLFWVGTLLGALKMIGFDEHCSMFAASCSGRVRLASLPSRPSPARRPCTRFFSSHLLGLVRTSPAIPTGTASNRTG